VSGKQVFRGAIGAHRANFTKDGGTDLSVIVSGTNLVKLNHEEFSKYHLCQSKIDMAHVYILFFNNKPIQNSPELLLVLSDALSDLDKVNYGEYSKYQLCSSKIYTTQNLILKNDPIGELEKSLPRLFRTDMMVHNEVESSNNGL